MDELNKYTPDEIGQLTRELIRSDGIEHEDTEDNVFSDYLIVFNIKDERYRCYVQANSMDEALGIFFVNHPHITYDMIEDHMEE